MNNSEFTSAYALELFNQLDKEGRVMVIRAAVDELRRVKTASGEDGRYQVDGSNRYRTEGKLYAGSNVIPFRKVARQK